jgi:hypothetical protein
VVEPSIYHSPVERASVVEPSIYHTPIEHAHVVEPSFYHTATLRLLYGIVVD